MEDKTKTPTFWATMVCMVTFGMLGSTVVAPLLFPRGPARGFSFGPVLCGAIGGGLGGLLGSLIGKLIEGTPKKE